VLADTLIAGAVLAVVVGGQFWKQGAAVPPPGSIFGEDDDDGVAHGRITDNVDCMEIDHHPKSADDKNETDPFSDWNHA
jgi:hypothetical protein